MILEISRVISRVKKIVYIYILHWISNLISINDILHLYVPPLMFVGFNPSILGSLWVNNGDYSKFYIISSNFFSILLVNWLFYYEIIANWLFKILHEIF